MGVRLRALVERGEGERSIGRGYSPASSTPSVGETDEASKVVVVACATAPKAPSHWRTTKATGRRVRFVAPAVDPLGCGEHRVSASTRRIAHASARRRAARPRRRRYGPCAGGARRPSNARRRLSNVSTARCVGLDAWGRTPVGRAHPYDGGRASTVEGIILAPAAKVTPITSRGCASAARRESAESREAHRKRCVLIARPGARAQKRARASAGIEEPGRNGPRECDARRAAGIPRTEQRPRQRSRLESRVRRPSEAGVR